MEGKVVFEEGSKATLAGWVYLEDSRGNPELLAVRQHSAGRMVDKAGMEGTLDKAYSAEMVFSEADLGSQVRFVLRQNCNPGWVEVYANRHAGCLLHRP